MKLLKIILMVASIILIVLLGIFFFLNKNGLSLLNIRTIPTVPPLPPPILPAESLPTATSLTGKIVDVTENSITLRYSFPKPQFNQENPTADNIQIEEKDYKVLLTPETKLYKLIISGKSPIPTKEDALVDDLKKDLQVTVYSDTDVTTTDQFTAAYIEIAPLPPNPAQPAAQ